MGTGAGVASGRGDAGGSGDDGEAARAGLVWVGSRNEKKLCDKECLCCAREACQRES